MFQKLSNGCFKTIIFKSQTGDYNPWFKIISKPKKHSVDRCLRSNSGAPVAQYVKCWPAELTVWIRIPLSTELFAVEASAGQDGKRWQTDLANPGSRPTGGGSLFNHKRGFIG